MVTGIQSRQSAGCRSGEGCRGDGDFRPDEGFLGGADFQKDAGFRGGSWSLLGVRELEGGMFGMMGERWAETGSVRRNAGLS